MTMNHHSAVPDNTKVLIGPKGGTYYLRKGERVYLTDKEQPKRTKYNAPKRGAYLRYLENIKEV